MLCQTKLSFINKKDIYDTYEEGFYTGFISWNWPGYGELFRFQCPECYPCGTLTIALVS